MGLSYVGSISMGVLNPLGFAVAGALGASLVADALALAELVLSIDASVPPPTFTASLSAALDLQANLQAAVDIGLPSIDFQASGMVTVIASLSLELAFPLVFEALLEGEAGIYAYGYNGTGADFGAAVSTTINPSWPDGTSIEADSNALIIASVSPDVWDDVRTVFTVMPPNLPPGLTYLANGNLGIICGIFLTALGPTIAELKAKLFGALKLVASFSITPPSFSVSLSFIADMIASLELSIAIGLPGIVIQLEAIARLAIEIALKIDVIVSLVLTMSGINGGAYVYTYSGPGSGIGPALTSELATGWPGGASPTAEANALILGTVSPSAWSGMSQMFGGIFAKFGVQLKKTQSAFTLTAT